MPRYAVLGDTIVDTETDEPVSPDELNRSATPEEKAYLSRELTARSLMTNQEGEGGSGQVDEEIHGEAPTGGASDEPSPDRTTAPSLQEFLDVAQKDNPSVPRSKLATYWNDTYGHVDPKTLPSLETFLPAAKEDNPDVSDATLKKHWKDTYGILGAREKEPGFLESAVSGMGQGVRGLKESAVGTFERLQSPDSPWHKDAAKAADDIATEIQKHATPGELRDQPWYDIVRNPGEFGNFLGNTIVQSAPSLVGAVAGGVAGAPFGLAAPGAAAGLTAVTYFQQAGSSYREAFARYKKDGLDDTEAHDKAYNASGIAGLVSGVVNALAVPASLAAPFTSRIKNLAMQYVANVLVDSGDQVTGNLVKAGSYAPETKVTEDLGKAVLGSAVLSAPETMAAVKSVASGPAKVVVPPHAEPPPEQKPPEKIHPETIPAAIGVTDPTVSIDDAVKIAAAIVKEPVPGSAAGPILEPEPAEPNALANMIERGGALPTQEQLLEATRTKQPYDVPILQGAEPTEAQTIEPGQAFTPRAELEANPRTAIEAERARLAGMRRSKTEEPTSTAAPVTDVTLPTAAEIAYPPAERDRIKTQQELLERGREPVKRETYRTPLVEPGQPEAPLIQPVQSAIKQAPTLTAKERLAQERARLVESRATRLAKEQAALAEPTPAEEVQAENSPLKSAVEKAYPSVEDIHRLADAKGLKWDNNPVFMEMTQMVTGKKHLDALTPHQRQKMADQIGKIKGTTPTVVPTPVKPKEEQPALPMEQQTERLSTFDAAQVPRGSLIPEQNAEMLARAEKAQADLEIAGNERGTRVFHETTGQGGTQEVTGLKSATSAWYKEATTGPKKLSRERVDKAVQKIREDKGRDVGQDVQRIKELLLQDQEFTRSEFAPKTDADWQTLIETATGHAAVEQRAHEAATSPRNELPEPTDGQKEAGNYRLGHVRIAGLDLSIENPAGSTRSGVDKNGKPWEQTLADHYGYIRGTKGKDKEHIDLYVKAGTPTDYSGPVFVIDQNKVDSNVLDEHKAVLGVATSEEARKLYLANHAIGNSTFRSIKQFTMEEFKDWLKTGDKQKPVGIAGPHAKGETKPPSPETKPVNGETVAPEAEPFTLKTETAKKPKPKAPEQLGIPVPPTQVGGQPIIGREATAEEAPLFSKAAQTPEAEQTKLPEGAKEPWQMTQEEYAKEREGAYIQKRGGSVPANAANSVNMSASKQHERLVKEAIAEGKPVPSEVLADYPDLQQKAAAPEAPTAILANALRTAADQIEGKPEPVAGAKKPKQTAMTDIQDVGEKIGGARKDKWAQRGLTLVDLEGMTGGEESKYITKQNIWKPDYAAMVTAGTEPKAAALVKVLYDSLAAKPQKDTPEGRRNYLTMMGHVKTVLSPVRTVQEVKDAGATLRYELLGLPKPNEMRGVTQADRDLLQPKFDIFWSVVKGRSDPFYVGYSETARADKMIQQGFPNQEPWTRRYGVEQYHVGSGMTQHGAGVYAKRVFESADPWKDTFPNEQALTERFKQTGVWRVIERGTGKLVGYRTTEAEGKTLAQDLYENKKGSTEEGQEPSRPHLDTLTREGEDYRNGKDVTAEDFRSAFGFRGIEFGNYAASDERQKHINQAYDALRDLATVLGIPPKAISLNGSLGLAFGARGGGHAIAHYEPSKLVINITKINGPGSMAHEWGHALDHYFGELDRPDAYKGKARGISGWHTMARYTGDSKRLANLRPEMAQAFDRVMETLFHRDKTNADKVRDKELFLEKIQAALADSVQRLEKAKARPVAERNLDAISHLQKVVEQHKLNAQAQGKAIADLTGEDRPAGGYGKTETSFYKAAQKLSGTTGDYWKRPTEMFARSFESYVFDRLRGKSDYLVHGVEPDKFTKEKGYKENPYPAGVDREAINAAYTHLFDTMQSKETDQGTALFEPRQEGLQGPTAAQFKQAWTAGAPIGSTPQKVIDSSQQYPSGMMDDLAQRPYVQRLTRSVNTVFREMRRVLTASDAEFGQPIFAGLSPDDYYVGVNLRGPDAILLNPWGALWQAQQTIANEHIAESEEGEFMASNLLKTLLHELTHQQVEGHGQAFDEQLERNYTLVGFTRLATWQRLLMGTMRGDLHVLADDLTSQTPFWQARTGLSDENIGGDAESRPTYDRENVADQGSRAGPRSERPLPDGGERETATLDESPAFQRRSTGLYPLTPAQDQTGTITPTEARDHLGSAKAATRPYLLGALGLQQIADVYGREQPEVARYNQASQRMEADFLEMSGQSDALIKRWDGLKTDVADRMARVMEDARFAQFDADQTNNPLQPSTVDQKNLTAKFEALPKEAQQLYRDVRDYYANLSNHRFTAIKERIERSGGTPRNTKAAIDKLELAYEKTKGKVYFPFTRFGNHVVVAKKMQNGKEIDREVQTFDSPFQAEQFASTMKARGWTIKRTSATLYSQAADGSASQAVKEMQAIIDGLTFSDAPDLPGLTSLREQLSDALNQTFLNSLPDMSYAKHFIHAKEVKGFSKDALRAFAHSALHGAHHISRIQNADHLTRALSDLNTRIQKTEEGDVTEARQLYNEIVQRHESLLNPNTSPVAAWLGQLGFTMSLGGVIATGLTNATQVPLITLPWLGSRFGLVKSTAALAAAYKDFLDPKTLNRDSLFDASQSERLPLSERSMLKELQRRGRIDLTQTMDLAGRASQDNLTRVAKQVGTLQGRMAQLLGFTFHAPEVMNRQVTALATYRLAKGQGQSEADAVNQAERAIVDTHFIYSQENRPRYMSGNVLRVLTMFKQYSQNIAFLYGRAAQVWLSKNGGTPEEKRIARNQLLTMASLQYAAAGALGMPFVGTIADLVGLMMNAFGDDDDKKDWEVELRKFLADAVGKQAGEVLSHGLSRLTPWDMAARLGQNDLFFREPKKEREGHAAAMDWVTSLAGPVLSYGVNAYLGVGDVIKGLAQADSGHFLRGVEELVPAVLRNGVKALRYELEGGLRTRDKYKQLDVNYAEKLGQFFGFNPARAAEMYESTTAIKNAEHRTMNRRSELLDTFAAASQSHDTDARTQALADIRTFNQKHPTLRITGDTLARSRKGRMKHERGMEDGISLDRKRTPFREQGSFANL